MSGFRVSLFGGRRVLSCGFTDERDRATDSQKAPQERLEMRIKSDGSAPGPGKLLHQGVAISISLAEETTSRSEGKNQPEAGH